MIVRGYDIVGWQCDTQYELLRIYAHHGAPFCVLTVKQHYLPLTRQPRVAGGAPAVNHKATAIWLALWILAGNEHCNVCDGNMVSEYIFNFLWPLMNECIQYMFVAFATICSLSMPTFTSIKALVTINQTPKVWNFAGDVHNGFFHISVLKYSTTFRKIELSHYWP